MTRKLMIVAYYGDDPPWAARYWEQLRAMPDDGFDWLIHTDFDDFQWRVQHMLGIDPPDTIWNGTKIHDYRPAFAQIFADEVFGYDFWGHTDMDCVYGRLGEFYPDALLDDLDVLSDHTHYLCGPWTLYRNDPDRRISLTRRFRATSRWRDILLDPVTSGWVESRFTDSVNDSGLRIAYRLRHAWQQPELLERDGERLLHAGVEVPFFHFRHTKEWPLS